MTTETTPAAGEPSRSISLLDSIMCVIRGTPYLDKRYMCHGEPHFYSVPDYDRMEAEIAALLSNAGLDRQEDRR